MNPTSLYTVPTLIAALTLGNAALAETTSISAGMGSSFMRVVTARLGYLWSNADRRIRLDSSDGNIGTDINFEDDLGLQSSKGLSMGD